MPGWLVLDMELNNEGFFESQRQTRQRLRNRKLQNGDGKSYTNSKSLKV